jgi:hypothetical protein
MGTTLVAELNAENATDRIRAAAQILDRAWGRPQQAHNVRIERDHAADAAEAREKIAGLLSQRAPGRRERRRRVKHEAQIASRASVR